MKTIILIFSITMSTYVYSDILNGQEDTVGEFENVYQVAFKAQGNLYPHCTGTVLDDNTVLTAAHCTDNIRGLKRLKLLINGRYYKVDRLIIPNEYYALSSAYYAIGNKVKADPENEELLAEYRIKHKAVTLYDLVLVKLKRSLSRSLVKTTINFDQVEPNSSVTAVGFGYLSVERTQNGYVYNNPDRAQYRTERVASVSPFLEIVASGLDDQITSAGDSGGPILNESKEQVGVLRGISAHDDYVSSLYSPLNKHMEFIKKNTK